MKLKILFMFLLVPCYGRPLSRIPREAEIQTEQNKILNLGDEASKIVVKGGDCSRLENVTIIMNDQVGSCQISPSPVQLYPVLTGIVNAKNSYKTSLKVCKVHRRREAMGCGDFSHTYGQREISNEVIYVSAEECVQMISRGEFIESQTKQTIELEINGQVSRSLVVFGSLEDDGSCSYGGNWADQKTGDVYKYVVVTDHYVISVFEYETTVLDDEVTLPDFTSTKKTQGFSSNVGSYSWQKRGEECKDRFQEAAFGIAYSTTPTPGPGTIIIFNNTDDSLGSFTLGKFDPICGHPAYDSEFESIKLYFPENRLNRIGLTKTSAESIKLGDAIGSGVNYVVTHFNQRINDFIQQIRMMDCQKNKKDIELSLEMMNEHNSISTLFSSESGVYVVNNHGQISELGVCPFDTAYLRATDECYDDLAVYHKGQKAFLDRRHKIFKQTSVERSCEDPAVFQIGTIGLFWQRPHFERFDKEAAILEPKHGKLSYILDILPFKGSTIFGKALNNIGISLMRHIEAKDFIGNLNRGFQKQSTQTFGTLHDQIGPDNLVAGMTNFFKKELSKGFYGLLKLAQDVFISFALLGIALTLFLWIIGIFISAFVFDGAQKRIARLLTYIYRYIRFWLHVLGILEWNEAPAAYQPGPPPYIEPIQLPEIGPVEYYY